MGSVVLYAPHPDDETLSMGYPIVHWLAAGWDVHLVSMSRGAVPASSVKLDGSGPCGMPSHLYIHNPGQEGYPADLTDDQIGEARLKETRTALGAATTVAPNTGVTRVGNVYHYEGYLPANWGGPTTGQPPTPEGVALAQAIILSFVVQFPDAAHHTMSPTDDHPDHAACGQALRNLKNDPLYSAQLADSMFFVSRLYWDYTKKPDVLAEGPAWFPVVASRKADFDAVARKMRDAFYAWSPAHGAYGIGGHQVPNQFNRCFPDPGSTQAIAALWHD